MKRRLRVLVVDDNQDIVLTLRLLLEDAGYEVRGSYDGRQALLDFAEFDPDAVIADIGLPGASGWEMGRAMRRISDGDRPLMIAISGEFTRASDRVLTDMSGFNYFLAKPFDPGVLLALLAQPRTASRATSPSK